MNCIKRVRDVISFYIFFLQACENGRGAILLSVARGKVSEGIDFGNFNQFVKSLCTLLSVSQ